VHLEGPRTYFRRVGQELRIARIAAGLSTRHVGRLVGVAHTQILRIEAGLAPHVDIELISRLATVVGCELSMGIHPVRAPVRDKAHIALLRRFAARLHPSIRWRTEVPIPIPGDLRSADGVAATEEFGAIVEAETDSMTSRPSSVGCARNSATWEYSGASCSWPTPGTTATSSTTSQSSDANSRSARAVASRR
jgi:transcriptional regulator with XRE-family HTH domain